MRSSVIGSLVGMLPGAGADIAAWISYAVSKRFAKRPDEFGKESLEGIGDATGANNAALGSAWIPALVFGIPGDSVTAIAIGVLLTRNITPGPNIFDATEKPEQAAVVLSIYVTFILANLVLIPLGFALESFKIPLGPVALGIILGGQVEHKFIQCITKSTEVGAFLNSPISIVLGLVIALLWAAPTLISIMRERWGPCPQRRERSRVRVAPRHDGRTTRRTPKARRSTRRKSDF